MENIFVTFFTAIIVSWLTVQLSLKRFQKETLWVRKLDAYTKIIESLYDLKKCLIDEESHFLGEYSTNIDSEKIVNEIKVRFRMAEEELLKFKDIGSLILPAKAISLIKKYGDTVNNNECKDYDEYTNLIFKSADSCLKAFIDLAKIDLEKR